MEDLRQDRQYFLSLILEDLTLIPTNNPLIIIKISLPSLEVNIGIMHNMKLSLEPFLIQYHHILLMGDQPLLDIQWNL